MYYVYNESWSGIWNSRALNILQASEPLLTPEDQADAPQATCCRNSGVQRFEIQAVIGMSVLTGIGIVCLFGMLRCTDGEATVDVPMLRF